MDRSGVILVRPARSGRRTQQTTAASGGIIFVQITSVGRDTPPFLYGGRQVTPLGNNTYGAPYGQLFSPGQIINTLETAECGFDSFDVGTVVIATPGVTGTVEFSQVNQRGVYRG